MKNIIFKIGLLLITSIATNAQITKNIYGFKSGHVEYELTGNTTGTKSLWWDDYGAKSCTETNSVTVIEMFGIKNETKMHTVSVINVDTYWFANLNAKTGQEGSLSSMLGYTEVNEMNDADKEQFANQLIDSLGGERKGTERVLGCDCEVIKLLGSTGWNCKGVVLKSQVETLGVYANEIAISFDKNISIPSSKFEIIQGITYTNNDEYMKMMEQYMNTEGYGEEDE